VTVCLELGAIRDELCQKLGVNVMFRYGSAFGNMLIGRTPRDETPRFELEGAMVEQARELCDIGVDGVVSVNDAERKLFHRQSFPSDKGPTNKYQRTEHYIIHSPIEPFEHSADDQRAFVSVHRPTGRTLPAGLRHCDFRRRTAPRESRVSVSFAPGRTLGLRKPLLHPATTGRHRAPMTIP